MFIRESGLNFTNLCNGLIKPRTPLILNNELNVQSLIDAFSFLPSCQMPFYFFNLRGIELWPPPSFSSGRILLLITQSQLDFFINGTRASDLSCNAGIIPSGSTLFGSLITLAFIEGCNYPTKPICPFLFKNTNIGMLMTITDLIDASLIRNVLSFQKLENTSQTSINSYIPAVCLVGYGYTLDTDLLNPLVFEKLGYLSIVRSIGVIQTDMFMHFPHLYNIIFLLDNYANFFHKNGVKWTSYMLSQSTVTFSNDDKNDLSSNALTGNRNYTFPDKDFCIFAPWPVGRVKFVLQNFPHVQCTDIISWLEPINSFVGLYCEYGNVSYFESKVSKCILKNDNGPTNLFTEYYQVKIIIESTSSLLEFIAIPCASLLGFLLNYIIIWTINKNKEKDLKDAFYKYMSLNSKFNCAYCLIFLVYPISNCANPVAGYMCSSIRGSYASQLYKIVFVVYFGESIKMCANIFFILMAVNRYMLVGRDGYNPILEGISKWDIKKVLVVSICTSLAINTGHIFQFALNNGKEYKSNMAITLNYNYYYTYDTYPTLNRFDAFSSRAVSWYLLAYFLVNFVLFFVINTSVEVILVMKLHKEMEQKKKKNLTFKRDKSVKAATTTLISFRKKRKQDIEEGAERRAIVMVAVNAVLNFVLRLPELFSVFSISNSLVGWAFIDAFPTIPILMTDIAYFLYILTFTTTFLIYYLFNLKFKQSFAEYTHAKKRS
jgi:hypothetical protein